MKFKPTFTGGRVAIPLLIIMGFSWFLIGLIPDREQLSDATREDQDLPASIIEEAQDLTSEISSVVTQQSAEQLPAEIPSNHLVKRGDTLSKIWELHGGQYAEAVQVAASMKKAGVSSRDLRPGETLVLSKCSESGLIKSFERSLSEGRQMVVRRAEGEEFSVQIIEPTITTHEKEARGVVHSNIATTAQELNIPYSVVDEFIDLFGGRIEFTRDMRVGDSFTIVYDERTTEDGRALTPGSIKAASIKSSGKLLVAVRHIGSDGKARYYDQKGEILGNYFLRYPVKFTRISSVFTGSRFHPVLKVRKAHNGVDFAAPTGTPVRSVADGTIEAAGYTRANGNWVKIRHSDRWSTAYLHLSKIEKGIKRGSKVIRGDQIGRVGSTGYATGPHLHFSLYDRGKYVDPMKTTLPKMPQNGEVIPTDFLASVLDRLRQSHETSQLASKDILDSPFSTSELRARG